MILVIMKKQTISILKMTYLYRLDEKNEKETISVSITKSMKATGSR